MSFVMVGEVDLWRFSEQLAMLNRLRGIQMQIKSEPKETRSAALRKALEKVRASIETATTLHQHIDNSHSWFPNGFVGELATIV